jgi:hypothetical protein
MKWAQPGGDIAQANSRQRARDSIKITVRSDTVNYRLVNIPVGIKVVNFAIKKPAAYTCFAAARWPHYKPYFPLVIFNGQIGCVLPVAATLGVKQRLYTRRAVTVKIAASVVNLYFHTATILRVKPIFLSVS